MCITANFKRLWEENYDETFKDDGFAKIDSLLDDSLFLNSSSSWSKYSVARDEYTRRQLLIEIDVLVAMMSRVTLFLLIT